MQKVFAISYTVSLFSRSCGRKNPPEFDEATTYESGRNQEEDQFRLDGQTVPGI